MKIRNISALLLGIIVLSLYSCKEKITSVSLPKQEKAGVSLPQTEGSLAEYIEIVPEAYVLDLMTDCPTMTVNVKLLQRLISDENAKPVIGDDTYIALVDSLGAEVTSVRMSLDSISKMQLLTFLSTTAGGQLKLKFKGNPVSEEYKDTIAVLASNIKLIANIDYDIDDKKIASMLDEFESVISSFENVCADPLYRMSTMGMREGQILEDRAKALKAGLAPVVRHMSKTDRKRYDSSCRDLALHSKTFHS